MDSFINDPHIMKLLSKINEFIFMLGGYLMLSGWWLDSSIFANIGAYIMSGSFICGVIYGIFVTLYNLAKNKKEEEKEG
jgi:hypothetical protein